MKEHTFKRGDAVVVKRENKRKGQTPYEPYVYLITQVKGSQIEAVRVKDERKICRDASKFKSLCMIPQQPDREDPHRYNQPKVPLSLSARPTKPASAHPHELSATPAPPLRRSERLLKKKGQ